MTDPEPDTEDRSQTSSVTAADVLARKLIDAVAKLLAELDTLTSIPQRVKRMEVAGDWAEVLTALMDAAVFYQEVRREEMTAMPFEPFGILTGLQMVRNEAMVPLEYINAEEENQHRHPESDAMQANLISSRRGGTATGFLAQHKPLIDLDMECELRPSKTPGHFHLIINKWVEDDRYWAMLYAMVGAGIVEEGFVRLAKERGATHIRAFPTATGWRNEKYKNNILPEPES